MINGLYSGSDIFLEKARALYPEFYETEYYPLPESLPTDNELWHGKSFTLDFGTHVVGYLTLSMQCDGDPGSPLEAVFEFAEDPCEYDPRPYTGALSSTWIQRETVYIDDPNAPFVLRRRYAFRYVKVTFPANTNYSVKYRSCVVRGVTSADMNAFSPLPAGTGDFIRKIDEVGVRTLKNCMQSVFEDGPKRDRRLWLGDLYLQAKANYLTFKNTDLVKRCLYLFAGIPHANGGLSSAIYQEPILRNQDWILHDYALFFAGTLKDLYEFEKDPEIVKELWPVALRQAEIAVEAVSDNGLVNTAYYFVDWCGPLDKSAAAQGIAVTMLKDTLFLAGVAGDNEAEVFLKGQIERLEEALRKLYDPDAGLFRGITGQISVQSQMWGALSGVLDPVKTKALLEKITSEKDSCEVNTVTPYAKHYLTEALFRAGLKEQGAELVREYWGGMVRAGADCFWEVYVPSDPDLSPYGDKRINSYCHAWSCTASYFIRKYGLK